MIALSLFIAAFICSALHARLTQKSYKDLLLRYLLLFNMGAMGILAAYAHVFMGPATAAEIGWPAGSPFQFEIGMANLSYGALGILAFWSSEGFRRASVIGWATLLMGCFVGHMINYATTGDAAPYNIGIYIWFYDLALPLAALVLITKKSH